jgi:hypothetical protein
MARAGTFLERENPMTKKQKTRGIDGDAFLAAQLSDPRVRHHFEQRRIVH